jgi:hypothetical protein
MNTNKVNITKEIEQIEDPTNKGMVFYRLQLSSRPSLGVIIGIYDFWKDHAPNFGLNHIEILFDQARNPLIHATSTDDVTDIIDLLQVALGSVTSRQY